jgi:hypothetical protein
MPFRLLDGDESSSEMSLGTGDPGVHEVEGRLFEAIDDAGLRVVVRNGPIDLPDPDGLPGENVLVDPAESGDQADPTAFNPDAGRSSGEVDRRAALGTLGLVLIVVLVEVVIGSR